MSSHIKRLFFLSLIFVNFTTSLRGDEPVELKLTPRAVEQPLLKYRLLPAEFELTDGNAAPVLLRMIWDQVPYMKSIYGTLDDDLELALDDPELTANRTQSFDGFYGYLKDAAYLRSANWEYPIFRESPIAYILLPDAQGAREMVGKGLSVWIRYQIATGNLDKAREGITVGLAVARHYARTPFVIIQLVSQALCKMTLDRVVELIAQPDCPNLYWSLAALPRPLLESRQAIELEERMYEFSLAGLKQLDENWNGDPTLLRKIRRDELDHLDDPRSRAEWDALYRATFYLYAESGFAPLDQQEWEETRKRIIAHARKEMTAESIADIPRIMLMSDPEIAIRWFVKHHRRLSQKITALMSLPPKQAIPRLRVLQQEIKTFREENGLKTLFNLENPFNLYVLLRRNDRHIALLQTIEGLRHYAATHEGKLPASLAEMTETPAANDPLTEEPFEYVLEGETALLSAPGFESGEQTLAEYRYRVKMRE